MLRWLTSCHKLERERHEALYEIERIRPKFSEVLTSDNLQLSRPTRR